jgi:hypothetical protein
MRGFFKHKIFASLFLKPIILSVGSLPSWVCLYMFATKSQKYKLILKLDFKILLKIY